jgi:6-phosphogluconate dehydrogenase (decarboxylating)
MAMDGRYVGAGHFTKMIHNGVEYGLTQAYAKGFSILQHKSDFTSTCTWSPRSGAAATWCVHGCSISPPTRCRRIRA